MKALSTTTFCPTRLNFKLSGPEISSKYLDLESIYRRSIDLILATETKDINFKNTFGRLGLVDSIVAAESVECTLPSLVSTIKEVREVSLQIKQKFTQLWASTYFNFDLYSFLKQSADIIQQKEKLNEEDQRLIKKTLQLFERNGIHLDTQKRERISSYREKMSTLSEKFCSNINEDNSMVPLIQDELDGLDSNFYKFLPREGDAYLVGCKGPQYMAVMQNAKKENTRKKMLQTTNSRCINENLPLLQEIVYLRYEASQLLGFPSHSSFQMSTKMASTTSRVNEFLSFFNDRFEEEFYEDYALLQRLKKEVYGDATINNWDVLHLKKLARERNLSIDEEEVKQYFPLNHVVKAVLEVYADVLCIKMKPLESVPVWHESVVAYAVYDNDDGDAAGSSNDKVIGYFYLDLFSRPGKYAHQCVFPLLPSFVNDEGVHSKPACAILGNLTPSTPERPSLLMFEEVRTFFHEFGHVMHCVLTRASYSLFSWCWPIVPWPGGVEQDFLEVPSTMFELWMYNPSVLKRVSAHYQSLNPSKEEATVTTTPASASAAPAPTASTPAPAAPVPTTASTVTTTAVPAPATTATTVPRTLPPELIQRIARSQFYLSSITQKIFIAYCLYDLLIHGTPTFASTSTSTTTTTSNTSTPTSGTNAGTSTSTISPRFIWKDHQDLDLISSFETIMKNIARQNIIPGTWKVASWYHPCSGYDAGYFGYLWSEVFAHDLFGEFHRSPQGCFDKVLGKRIRECLLSQGAKMDGIEMVKMFLGREPSYDAFLERKKRLSGEL